MVIEYVSKTKKHNDVATFNAFISMMVNINVKITRLLISYLLSLATKNLDLGDECNEDYESAVGLLCSPSLRCARCSSDTPRTCKAASDDSGTCTSSGNGTKERYLNIKIYI